MTPTPADLEPTSWSTGAVAELRAALLEHYDRRRRSLPWRGEADPYRVLVSEVMLQQTRVETVEKYYGPWLERFPDLSALAAAEEDDVLKAWEGLGYYRRARNLHRAARACRERPDGSVPSSYVELRRLPGVGDYTAGAVASIAFGERVPAPDGNARRVLSRVFDAHDPKPAWLRDTAAGLVDPDRPGDWNQALMELGATLCAPRSPRCDECPLASWCRARERGTQRERPGAPARSPAKRVAFALAVLRDAGGRVLLERRPKEGLLGGMWAFPESELGWGDSAASSRQLDGDVEDAVLGVAAALGARPLGCPERLKSYEHRFTHIHATYAPCVLAVDASAVTCDGRAWVRPGSPTRLALPVAQRLLLDRLGARGRDGEG